MVNFRCHPGWVKGHPDSCDFRVCLFLIEIGIAWEGKICPQCGWALTSLLRTQTEQKAEEGQICSLSSGPGTSFFSCSWTLKLQVLQFLDSGTYTGGPLGYQAIIRRLRFKPSASLGSQAFRLGRSHWFSGLSWDFSAFIISRVKFH
jgi:hypothetical protein